MFTIGSDVALFESAAVDAPMDIAGRPALRLFVKSDAADLDISVRLYDVAPDGESLAMVEGYQRLRWRGGDDRSQEARSLTSNAEEIAVELWPIAWRLGKGHRLRIAIAGSNFPRFDRNPQSEATPGEASPNDFVTAQVEIFHDVERPSRIELPIVAA